MEAPSPSIRLSALGKTRGRTDEGAGGGMRKIGVVGGLMGWAEGFFSKRAITSDEGCAGFKFRCRYDFTFIRSIRRR